MIENAGAYAAGGLVFGVVVFWAVWRVWKALQRLSLGRPSAARSE